MTALLFFRATNLECAVVKDLLRLYERPSEQAINFSKSGIFFSGNVSHEVRHQLSNVLGITASFTFGRYLGLPSLISRNKKSVFSYLKDKVWQRIQHWRKRPLSKASKEILVKSVGQAIPSFCMNAFLLPPSLADEIQKMLNSFWWGSDKEGSRGINWLSWDRMSMRKDTVVLVSVICMPLILQCLGNKGLRWKIGTGVGINVWSDPWLRDSSNMFIETPIVPALHDLTVIDLMVPGVKMWDIEQIKDLFCERDVIEILSIPLVSNMHCDKRIWHFSKDGNYTVRSAYRVASERVCRNNIPNRVNLEARGVVVPLSCVLCDDYVENSWHLFVGCSYALNCWKHVHLEQTVLSCAESVDGFVEFMHKALATWSEVDLGKLAMVIWSIWRQRNCKLWKNTLQTESRAVFFALEFLCGWLQAQERKKQVRSVDHSNSHGNVVDPWEKPLIDVLKCNVDVAVFSASQTMGHGMLIRNDRGEFVATKSLVSSGVYAVKEREVLGLLHALRWIKELGYERVIFELDSKTVVDVVNSSLLDVSEFGSLVSTCKNLLYDSIGFSVVFVKRGKNAAAHCLAQSVCDYVSSSVWWSVPPFLCTQLYADCTVLHHMND
ncbi:hypothetical protein PTKIN_Ptkin05aG0041600 [Pterospermum kingtungense]